MVSELRSKGASGGESKKVEDLLSRKVPARKEKLQRFFPWQALATQLSTFNIPPFPFLKVRTKTFGV